MNGEERSQPEKQTLVRDIGEQGLLRILQSFCPADLIGDDAAVVTPTPGRSLVVTTDVLVDGVHFSHQTTTPQDAGWRAAAANLSDLAAMGASPLGITVGLGLPGEVPVAWVEQLYQGMTQCLQPYSTPIMGGDVVRSPIITVSITAFGEVIPSQVIRRSTAQPGDAILVTGYHGSSRAGLELLLHPEKGEGLAESDRALLIKAHQRPVPRLDVVELLRREVGGEGEEDRGDGEGGKFNSAPSTIHHSPSTIHRSGMDSSDGLADAIVQICRTSGVGARIDRKRIPIHPALSAWVGDQKALEWALYGGEDFELVLCLPMTIAVSLLPQLGKGAAIVGAVTAAPGVALVDGEGSASEEWLNLEAGFQHFTQ
jgi:thiamine-monophosphate kinase